MSGMEVVAVIGVVAAVVSAYKDGGKIVKQIKAKRAAKRAPPPTVSLEASLERGPLAVEQAKDSGIERYGPKFATGDQIATQALQEILIHLQGTLLRHLWAAQEDDNMTDFNIVVDASDFGRIKSVTVLNELYMRMAQSAEIPRLLPDVERVYTLPAAISAGLPWEAESQSSRAHDPLPAQSRPIFQTPAKTPSVLSSSPNDSTVTQDSVEPQFLAAKKKWGMPFRSRTPRISSSAPEEVYTPNQQTRLIEPSISKSSPFNSTGQSSPDTRKPSPYTSHLERPLSESWRPSPELNIDEDNPWQEEYSSASSVRDVAVSTSIAEETQKDFHGPQRQSTDWTYVDDGILPTHKTEAPYLTESRTSQTRLAASPPMPTEDGPISPGSMATPGPGIFRSMFGRRTSSEASQVEEKRPPLKRLDNSRKSSPRVSRKNSAMEPAPSSSSKDLYSGYCKGAYKLQVGLVKEGMKICNQSTSMTGQSNYWACASSKCCFEGAACKIGKTWEFDNSLRTIQGVQYRWTLLAKSHVAMSRSKNHYYDYQCILCTEQEHPATIHHGEQAFMEHILTHRNQRSSLLKSEKIVVKTGRMALDHEVFDVNFPQLVENAQYHGRTLVNSPNIDEGSQKNTTSPEEEEVFDWSTPEPPVDDSHWIAHA